MQLKTGVMAISAIGLLFLGACASGNQATNPASSPAASAPAETPSTAVSPAAASPATNAKTGETHSHGGQDR